MTTSRSSAADYVSRNTFVPLVDGSLTMRVAPQTRKWSNTMNSTNIHFRIDDAHSRKHWVRSPRRAVNTMDLMACRWPVIDNADIARWVNEGGALGSEEKSFQVTLDSCGTERA